MISPLKVCWVPLEEGTRIDLAISSVVGHLDDFVFFPVQITCWRSFLPLSRSVISECFSRIHLCIFESVFWDSWWVLPNCPPETGCSKAFLNSLKSSVSGTHLIYHPPRLEGPGLPGLRRQYACATPWRGPWKDPCHLLGEGECLWPHGPGPEEVTFLPSPNLCLSES